MDMGQSQLTVQEVQLKIKNVKNLKGKARQGKFFLPHK